MKLEMRTPRISYSDEQYNIDVLVVSENASVFGEHTFRIWIRGVYIGMPSSMPHPFVLSVGLTSVLMVVFAVVCLKMNRTRTILDRLRFIRLASAVYDPFEKFLHIARNLMKQLPESSKGPPEQSGDDAGQAEKEDGSSSGEMSYGEMLQIENTLVKTIRSFQPEAKQLARHDPALRQYIEIILEAYRERRGEGESDTSRGSTPAERCELGIAFAGAQKKFLKLPEHARTFIQECEACNARLKRLDIEMLRNPARIKQSYHVLAEELEYFIDRDDKSDFDPSLAETRHWNGLDRSNSRSKFCKFVSSLDILLADLPPDEILRLVRSPDWVTYSTFVTAISDYDSKYSVNGLYDLISGEVAKVEKEERIVENHSNDDYSIRSVRAPASTHAAALDDYFEACRDARKDGCKSFGEEWDLFDRECRDCHEETSRMWEWCVKLSGERKLDASFRDSFDEDEEDE